MSIPASTACTCSALRRLTRTVSRLYDFHLAPFGLKTTQFSLLHHIQRDPLPVAELAARVVTDRTTLTRNLKPLIDAGWVVLMPGTDARQRIATITTEGIAKLDASAHAWCTAQAEIATSLGATEVHKLHSQIQTAMAVLLPLLDEKIHDHSL